MADVTDLENASLLLLDSPINSTTSNFSYFSDFNATVFPTEDVEGFQYVLLQFFYGLICVIGLTGNSMVIYVILRYAKMKTVTNLYILNLAIADNMFLVGIPLLIYTSAVKRWVFGYAMCKIYMVSALVNQITSSLFLLVMSMDRYLAVCHAISAMKIRTTRNAKLFCVATWSASILLMVPVFTYSKLVTHHEFFNDSYTCMVEWPDNNVIDPEKAFTLYTFFLGFSSPLVFTSIFYILVISKLRTLGPRKMASGKARGGAGGRKKKVTRLVLTVVTVYVCCWLPYWVLQLVLVYAEPQIDFIFYIIMFIYALAYANSAMNPILYAFLSDVFKQSFVKACSCLLRRHASDASGQSRATMNGSLVLTGKVAGAAKPGRTQRPLLGKPVAHDDESEEEELGKPGATFTNTGAAVKELYEASNMLLKNGMALSKPRAAADEDRVEENRV